MYPFYSNIILIYIANCITCASLPSWVRRAMHRISLSNAITLCFQIKLFIASIHLVTWPDPPPDLLNSQTSMSQNDLKWDVNCFAPICCRTWKKTSTTYEGNSLISIKLYYYYLLFPHATYLICCRLDFIFFQQHFPKYA